MFVFLVTISLCCSIACTGGMTVKEKEKPKANPVDSILERLGETVAELKSYQAKIKHTFRQPLLESETVRKGRLYYKKEAARSKLRLDFDTLKQDDNKEQAYREQVFFDGVWLVRIDYQLKRVEYRQLAEPNAPLEVLDLAGGYLPMVGFAKTEDLKKQFDITLVEQARSKSNEPIHLRLQVKNNSIYKNDYSAIDLWLDAKLFLPVKIVTISSQDETQMLEFYNQSVNVGRHPAEKKLSDGIFQVEIPDGFSKNVIELKHKVTGESRQ